MTRGGFRNVIAAGFTAALIAGCGNSVERAFSNCVASAHKQTVAGSKGGLPPELAKTFEKAARAMAEDTCSIIRNECQQDPQSDMCQRLVQQYNK